MRGRLNHPGRDDAEPSPPKGIELGIERTVLGLISIMIRTEWWGTPPGPLATTMISGVGVDSPGRSSLLT